jgi:hypothetical protein
MRNFPIFIFIAIIIVLLQAAQDPRVQAYAHWMISYIESLKLFW